MMKCNLKSIKFKTWLYMMGVVAVILVLMWLLQVVFLQRFYEFSKEKDVRQVQKSVVETLSGGELSAAYQEVLKIAGANELYVEVYNEQEEIVQNPFMYINYQSFQNKRMPDIPIDNNHGINRSVVDELSKMDQTSLIKRQIDRESNVSGIFLANKFTNNGQNYYVLTRSSLIPVQATSDILKEIFVIILFVVLVISLLLSFLFSSSVTKPIHQLSEAAKKVAEGNYNIEIPVKTRDEMGLLSEDFNQMARELSKVDSLRKDLIANVSHELRTPLTMIKGYAETIKDLTGNNPEKRNKQLDIIIDETDRLSDLISTMLDLSQLQAGKIQFDHRKFNVSRLVERIAKQYGIFKDKGYHITMKIMPEVYLVGDEGRFEQVVYNLIDNAINHSGDEQQVDIVLEEERLLVHNSGDVIDPEDLPHIWDRFYKIDQSGRRRVTGTGIGLSIVKEVLNAHHLAYGVKSAEGQGTTFWVELRQEARAL